MNCFDYIFDINMHNAEEVDKTVRSILEVFNLENSEDDLWNNVKQTIEEMEVKNVNINTFFYEAFEYIKYLLLEEYPLLTDENIYIYINGELDTHFNIVVDGEYHNYNNIGDWEKFYQNNFDPYMIDGLKISLDMKEKFKEEELQKIVKVINKISDLKEALDFGMNLYTEDGLIHLIKNEEKYFLGINCENYGDEVESGFLVEVSSEDFHDFIIQAKGILFQDL